jgi:translation initiation factor 1
LIWASIQYSDRASRITFHESPLSPSQINPATAPWHSFLFVGVFICKFGAKKMPNLNDPFTGLNSAGLPPGTSNEPDPIQPQRKSRGRVDILRQKAGRGGKTVTVVKNFVGIGLPEKEELAREMRKVCGTGGTVKDGQIEIQGDQREAVARILTLAGFKPVFAGG